MMMFDKWMGEAELLTLTFNLSCSTSQLWRNEDGIAELLAKKKRGGDGVEVVVRCGLCLKRIRPRVDMGEW